MTFTSAHCVAKYHTVNSSQKSYLCCLHLSIGLALADAGPDARPRRGAPLSSYFMTSSCSVNRVMIVVERRYAVQH